MSLDPNSYSYAFLQVLDLSVDLSAASAAEEWGICNFPFMFAHVMPSVG